MTRNELMRSLKVLNFWWHLPSKDFRPWEVQPCIGNSYKMDILLLLQITYYKQIISYTDHVVYPSCNKDWTIKKVAPLWNASAIVPEDNGIENCIFSMI